MSEDGGSKCLHCGGEMPIAAVQRPSRVYCGKSCYWAARHRRRYQHKGQYHKPLHDYHCVTCGRPFRSVDRGRRKCSTFCGTRREDAEHPASLLTATYLETRLRYDPGTGNFTWLDREVQSGRDAQWNSRFSGKPAGTVRMGHRAITIDRIIYRAGRLAWFNVTGEWPENLIGYVDGDPGNTRFANLRQAN